MPTRWSARPLASNPIESHGDAETPALPGSLRRFPVKFLFRAALVAALAFPSAAHAQYWCTETRDLRMVYNGGTLNFMAPYTAQCFENSLRFHEALFHYTPEERVNVILDDFQDFGNAGVWVN